MSKSTKKSSESTRKPKKSVTHHNVKTVSEKPKASNKSRKLLSNKSNKFASNKSKKLPSNKSKKLPSNKSKKLPSNKSKKLPTFRRKRLTKHILRHRVKKVFKSKSKIPRGVVYFGHVPHGFYEDEMREFFSQFGKVTNINIPRSQRTGNYRGYAFVEFYYPEVAKIVAETMNNYLMFQKVLKAKYIPPKEQKPICFRLRKYKTPLLVRRLKFLRRQNYRVLSEKENKEAVDRVQKNLEKKKRKLEKLGLNCNFIITGNESSPLDDDTEIIQNECDSTIIRSNVAEDKSHTVKNDVVITPDESDNVKNDADSPKKKLSVSSVKRIKKRKKVPSS